MYSFPILNQPIVLCPVLTVASWPAYWFLRRQVRLFGIPISLRIFQFVVIHTVSDIVPQILDPITNLERNKVKISQSCLTLWSHGWYSPWNSPGQNTGVGSLSLLQGIFPTQGSNPGSIHPHCRWILYQLSHQGSPRILEWVAYPFSRGSSWLRNRTRISCIAGRFSTNWAIREAP